MSPGVSGSVLRVAIAGCGERGREHAGAVRSVAGLELSAVADPAPGAAERLGAPGFVSLDRMLAAGAPDVLVLSTPPAIRADAVAAAVAAGVRAIVVEKPIATSHAEAAELARRCSDAGVMLVPGHQLRFAPAFIALREAVRGGELGELELIRASAFGDLMDQGPHLLDAVLWLAGGARVRWALAQRDRTERHTRDFYATYLELDGGIRALLETGPRYQRPAGCTDDWLGLRVTVIGSRGLGEATAAGGGRVVGASGARELPGDLDSYLEATRALHADVRDSLRGDRAQRCDTGDAVHGIAVLEAARESSSAGKRVEPAALRQASAGGGGPAVSVLIPVPDHRGYLLKCLEGWRQQTLEDDRYELILASDGTDVELDRKAEELLRPNDRLLTLKAEHELRLYAAAADAASGEVLLLTEPHCVPERGCLDELLGFIGSGDWDGACIRSTGLGGGALARAEERLYDRGFADWSADGHWCKVILRGFAVKADVYRATGGFLPDCGRFAEYALAMRLHELGARLGYAAGACVRHAYTSSFRELSPPVADFAAGECAYRALHEDDDRYLPPPPEWLARGELHGGARRLAGTALRNIARPGVIVRPAAARANLRALARHAPVALAGPRARIACERIALAAAKARCRALAPFAPETADAIYADVYERIARIARLGWIAANETPSSALEPRQRWPVVDIPPQRLLGFHPPERYDGAHFRWSSATAALALPMPQNARRVRLETPGFRPLKRLCLGVYVGGRRLRSSQVVMDELGIEFELPPSTNGADRDIALACSPFPARGDPRELGLPLSEVLISA